MAVERLDISSVACELEVGGISGIVFVCRVNPNVIGEPFEAPSKSGRIFKFR